MVKSLLFRTLYLLNFGYCCFCPKKIGHNSYLVFLVFKILKLRRGDSVKIRHGYNRIPHGSRRSPPWLCEKTVMALGEICDLCRLACKS